MEEGAEDIPGLEDFPFELLSKENQELVRKIKEKTREVTSRERKIEEYQERTGVLKEHLKNVRKEVENTQQLLAAREKEVKSESHMRSLSLREAARLKSDAMQVGKQIREMEERLNTVQNDVFKANERLDEFKVQMDWNQEEFEQWALAERQKDEDSLTLEKYRRMDESRIKELTLQLERLTTNTSQSQRKLTEEITETKAIQIELEKTSDDFKQEHEEREALIRQWEEAIDAMSKRDAAIADAGDQFARLRGRVKERKEEVGDRARFLEIEINNNKELENKIGAAERMAKNQSGVYEDVKRQVNELEEELEILKSTLSRQTSLLMRQKTENEQLASEHERRTAKLGQMKARADELEHQKKQEEAGEKSMVRDAMQLEKEMEERTQEAARLEKKVQSEKEEHFRQVSELQKLREKEAQLLAEIAGSQSQNKNVQLMLKEYDQQAFKQQELLYNIEFQIQQMERKVSRASGERSEDEKRKLNERIRELSGVVDEKKQRHRMLSDQLKRVMDEMRRATVQRQDAERRLTSMRESMQEISMRNESVQLEISQTLKQKEDKLVEHDLLRLKLKKVRENLTEHGEQLLGLQNRKEQLTLALRERVSEARSEVEMRRVETRLVDEEVHKLKIEYAERCGKIERLRSRYENAMEKIRGMLKKDGSVDDDGAADGEISQATFIVRAAQRREELQQKGDLLDVKIQKLEKEQRAMEKTVGLLRAKNQGFSQSFKKADGGGADAAKRDRLLERTRGVQSTIHAQRKEIAEVESDNEHLREQAGAMHSEIERIEREIEDAEKSVGQLHADCAAQKEKFEGYEKKIDILRKRHRRAAGVSEETRTFEEMDMDVHEIRLKNRETVSSLTQVAQANPTFAEVMEGIMRELGMSMPAGLSRTRDVV
eukprot:TRINITY_DN3494_c0_g1_i1.p1 TRINITY_DN3494_c0_g1~~TRINITY_DN3494_c0_g1_i1.p1  ORF type:complete len:924 (-),score=333.31 TRINITY_DN3494_c0_g1_i1:209-2881(-)